jgi:hypothetical protein
VGELGVFEGDRVTGAIVSPWPIIHFVAKWDVHVYDPGGRGPAPSSLNRISWQVEADTQAEAAAKALAHYKAAYGKAPEQLIVEADRADASREPREGPKPAGS